MTKNPTDPAPGIPLVVQLGFAGSRHLLDAAANPGVDAVKFETAVLAHLVGVLRELPRTLALSANHFLCGASQIAIGADTAFTRACERLGIRQRIFLPQHRDAYFAAKGENESRDFTDAEVKIAGQLLRSTHLIEDRVVSHSPVRAERFEDVNLELVRVSDVLIALRRADAAGRPGGTMDLIERARSRHKPLLEIIVAVKDGRPEFSERWHPNGLLPEKNSTPHFAAPALPSVLRGCTIRHGAEYARALTDFSGAEARRHQGLFKWAALGIIGAHFAATFLAVTALVIMALPVHEKPDAWIHHAVPWLLGGELVLLAIGLSWHWRLHHSRAAEQWATSRLISEVARSVQAMAHVPGYLGHLFTLPMPEFLRPLLRSLNVFHLEATRNLEPGGWPDRRDAYVHERLTHPRDGQIFYYTAQRRKARRWLHCAKIAFYTGSVFAFGATLLKLLLECGCGFLANVAPDPHPLLLGLGFLAIILPVVSVAALSLAASFDLEARRHTYDEMLRALEKQKAFLLAAKSEHEFVDLVLQTETRLLGENVNWFSRRVFTGVA